jgi:hypothetical protein
VKGLAIAKGRPGRGVAPWAWHIDAMRQARGYAVVSGGYDVTVHVDQHAADPPPAARAFRGRDQRLQQKVLVRPRTSQALDQAYDFRKLLVHDWSSVHDRPNRTSSCWPVNIGTSISGTRLSGASMIF